MWVCGLIVQCASLPRVEGFPEGLGSPRVGGGQYIYVACVVKLALGDVYYNNRFSAWIESSFYIDNMGELKPF